MLVRIKVSVPITRSLRLQNTAAKINTVKTKHWWKKINERKVTKKNRKVRKTKP